MIFVNTSRFAWIAECRNTIRELCSTFNAPRAIAKELQKMIASGATAADCNAIAEQSYILRYQIGA